MNKGNKMKNLLALTLIISIFFLACKEEANTPFQMLEKGKLELKRGKLKTALKYIKKSASEGYPEAQLQLGEMYYNGEGVQKNLVKALQWFEEAADKDHPIAQYNIGTMYLFGDGVENSAEVGG